MTGSEVTVLGSSSKIYKAFYYDQKGREVKRVQNNLLSGYDVTSTTYSFSDKLQTVTHTHTASGKTTRTETATYNYDYADRLSSITHKLGTGTAVTLVSYTYDTKGRLSSQKLHGSQTQSYTYNVRNWLTNTTSSKFTQSLTYNNGTSGYFNGNIQSMSWTANGASHSYSFTYDDANRMLNATHSSNYFTEKVTGYDKNGNITSLQRYGQTGASAYALLDNLTYTLNGNQLAKVEDAATATSYSGGTNFVNGSTATSEYTYDANGNLTKDLNKNITNISYNCLNLPQVITVSDGSTITYTYAADGTKLSTSHKIGTVTVRTDYCGNVIYESGAQKYLLNEVGYYNLSSSGYFYYLKDHQGNNRVVINSSGTVQETNHYYPFGGLFASTSVQPFKYNGKEFDSKKGLNWYDYGARHYDAVLGRFTTLDRYAEKYSPLSLYQYGANNPVRNIDVNGDSIAISYDKSNVMYKNGKIYNIDGSEYVGKVRGFLKKTISALGDLQKTEAGASLVSELQSSNNMYVIQKGKNRFEVNSYAAASANLSELSSVTGNIKGSSGSGGIIYWNPNSTSGGLDINGNTTRPAYIGLGHELSHASDANRGILHATRNFSNPNGIYTAFHKGLLKNEWRAVYYENLIRGQAGIPLRTHYGYGIFPEGILPLGPRLVDSNNLPINYH